MYTLVFALKGVKEWPPREDVELIEFPYPGGRIFPKALKDGRFHFWSISEEPIEYGKSKVIKHSIDVVTPQVNIGDNNSFVFVVSIGREGILGLKINGEMVFGELPKDNSPKDESFKSAPKVHSDADFTKENSEALEARRSKIAGMRSNKMKNHPGMMYDFESLREECLQIAELIDLIENNGRDYHVSGLLARERALLTEKARKLGLLQLCAAHIDAPLLFQYKQSAAAEALFKLGNGSVYFAPISTSAISKDSGASSIDLDVWLSLPGLSGRGKIFSNAEVIKGLGDGIGAHRLPEASEVVRFMKRPPAFAGPREIDEIGLTAINVGKLILNLAEPVIAQFMASWNDKKE